MAKRYPAYRLAELVRAWNWRLEKLCSAVGMTLSDWFKLMHGSRTCIHWTRWSDVLELELMARGMPLDAMWDRPGEPPFPIKRTLSTDHKLKHVEAPMFLTREYLDANELKYWDLAVDPFDDLEMADCWMGPRQRSIEAQIKRAVRLRDLLVIIGEVGSGKSTLVRRFLAQSTGDRTTALIAPNSLDKAAMTRSSLATAICQGLAPGERIPSSLEARSTRVHELLGHTLSAGVNPVLLIEEAHNLTHEALVALKELWDSGALYRMLAVVIVGQGDASGTKSLAGKLNDWRVREFSQRARVAKLDPYSEPDVLEYMAWRFKRVGKDVDQVWAKDGIRRLAANKATAYPLPLGNLAVAAMRVAANVSDTKVTAAHVARVAGK